MGLIDNFLPVSIETLNEKNLLTNRQDRKFIFSAELFNKVIEHCVLHYNILEITGVRSFRYSTTYYDTEDMHMYHQHQRGKKNRCKIRKRTYLENGNSFIEIKIKNNKDRTLKYRVPGNRPEDAFSLISSHTPYSVDALMETLSVNYRRITLLHKEKDEKITLDTELIFQNEKHQIAFDQLVFAEVKTTDAHSIEFCQIMKSMGIRSGSLSKYCLGVMSFYPTIKQNNFKLSLKKLLKPEYNGLA